MDIDLHGRVALITGGGRGLGATVALALAKAGADIAIMERDTCEMTAVVDLVRAQGCQAFGATADVGDWLAVQAAIGDIEENIGPVDILVNTTSMHAPLAIVEDAHPQEWAKAIAINLNGPFYCAHAVLPGMMEAEWGRIITITSSLATEAVPAMSAYSAAKAGLEHFTRVLAAELAPTNIVAVAVDPGTIETPAPQAADIVVPTAEECADLICRLCGSEGEAVRGRVMLAAN